MNNCPLVNLGSNYLLNWDQEKNIIYFGPYLANFSMAIRQIELLKFEFNKLAVKSNPVILKIVRQTQTSFNVELKVNDNLIDVAFNIDEFNLRKFYSLLKRQYPVVLTVFYEDKYSRRTECLAKTEKLGITLR